jgi:chromosome partitioning protein
MAKKVRKHGLRHIVAVSNNKGGAGKTSTVLNLASAIARRIEGYRVLVIDCDPQRNLSYFLGWDDQRELEGSPTLYTALCNEQQGLPVYRAQNGLYFSPASVNLNGIDAILSLRPNPSKALAEILQRPIDDHSGVKFADVAYDGINEISDEVVVKKSQPAPTLSEAFDFIFIDTQPAMSRMTYNALYASDGYIIPTEMEEASVKGLANIAVAAGKVGADTGNLTCHGILITKIDSKLRSARYYEPQIRQSFCETFQTAIRRSKDIIESQALREDVFTTYAGGRAAEDYTALATEYLKKFA